MRNILSSRNRRILEEFSWSDVLLALDFDGTLAPIVTDPQRARMRPRTRRLLGAVSRLYHVVVISGRAKRDVEGRVRGLGVREVVGNHGLEPWHDAERHLARVWRWRSRLEASIGSMQGVTIEDKRFSLAVHYRRSRAKKQAQALIARAAADLGEVRIVGGKQVVNLLPRDAPTKGMALERARERLRCDTAIYVGDDETDEDVFVLDQPGRLLTIRVGAKRASAARYCLPDQRSIDSLLRLLLEYRQRSGQRVAAI